jgi:hypothetical protein
MNRDQIGRKSERRPAKAEDDSAAHRKSFHV